MSCERILHELLDNIERYAYTATVQDMKDVACRVGGERAVCEEAKVLLNSLAISPDTLETLREARENLAEEFMNCLTRRMEYMAGKRIEKGA
jgi:hypothetical protein